MPLQIVRRDITQMNTDAIVNTTNENMIGLSGVDLAVHKGAGPKLDRECAKIAPLALGTAKITKGYNLKAKYIIHTSGPVWQGGLQGESIILKSCYVESLNLALEYKCSSIAFPLISSGSYGYPKDRVLKYAIEIISDFLCDHELDVFICIYDKSSYEFDRSLYEKLECLIHDEKRKSVSSDKDYCDFLSLEDTQTCEASEDVESFLPSQPPLEIAAAPKTVGLVARKSANKNESSNKSLQEYLKEMDKSFGDKLFDWIDRKGMTDTECYKKANVDKKTFSKIRCNPQKYKPSKQTAVAFAIALQLDIDQTQDLLASAGLTLSNSVPFDKIIRYFIVNENYDIFEINEALFEFDQVCLGC